MKILIIDIASYLHLDMFVKAILMFGESSVDELYYKFKGKDVYNNDEFEELFSQKLAKNRYDCVISTNFYPVIARMCHDRVLPYIAWSYDTPMNLLPSEEMTYETNTIFLFDKLEVQRYRQMGYERFFHLPLAVNTDRLDAFKPADEYRGDISFMGKLYRSKLPIIKEGLGPELLEYIDKLVMLQRKTIGRYILDDLVSQPIIDEFNRQYKEAGRNIQIIKEQLTYNVAEYVTYLDRVVLLEMLARRFDTHLYTYDIGDAEKQILKNVKIHGRLAYIDEMPRMFKSSKINLNGSMRAARSAIPLRALDIIGCGGFLLSSAQPELEEYFENGKEVVLYHNEEEAVELADYYLWHDTERKSIAKAGYERAKRDFTYEDRYRKMFEIAGVKMIYG